MKTRIIKRGDSYFIQQRIFFLWQDIYIGHGYQPCIPDLNQAKWHQKQFEAEWERWYGKILVIKS